MPEDAVTSERSKMLALLAHPDGWSRAWEASITPWDHGKAAPAFTDLIKSNEVPELSKGRALVPGCGSGYDVLLLAGTEGRDVAIGLDVSAAAKTVAEKLRDEHKISPSKAQFVTSDFFAYNPSQPFDVIYDHTFLCALTPDLRAQWAEKMASLCVPGGHLVAYMYPLSDHEGGPPYALSEQIYRDLLGPHFEEIFVEEIYNTFETRQRQEYGERLSLWRRRSQ
ncbi:S-adenosylmethionine: halide ion methyltransferase [Phlyctochytrium arcticum]|nr:S-adenosylmethionine: halide ion methyltransferase [Phlyctochytrium arcticum]